MDFDDICIELGRVSYKQGWRFEPYRHTWEGVWLSIIAELPDAYHPGEMVTVNIRTPIPPMVDSADLHRWLMYRLGRIEVHEMREFYRVDGKVVDDPHAPHADESADSLALARMAR